MPQSLLLRRAARLLMILTRRGATLDPLDRVCQEWQATPTLKHASPYADTAM